MFFEFFRWLIEQNLRIQTSTEASKSYCLLTISASLIETCYIYLLGGSNTWIFSNPNIFTFKARLSHQGAWRALNFVSCLKKHRNIPSYYLFLAKGRILFVFRIFVHFWGYLSACFKTSVSQYTYIDNTDELCYTTNFKENI